MHMHACMRGCVRSEVCKLVILLRHAGAGVHTPAPGGATAHEQSNLTPYPASSISAMHMPPLSYPGSIPQRHLVIQSVILGMRML